MLPHKVVLPSESLPNWASVIRASATLWPFISVLMVCTPDVRLSVPKAPRTKASASVGLVGRLTPLRWTWMVPGQTIRRAASRSSPYARLTKGTVYDGRCP